MNWSQLPNLISLFRLLLVPVVLVLMLEEAFTLALLVVLAAAVSDGIDGWLARRFGWYTPLGAVLDPLADKALMLVTYLGLGFLGLIPLWLPILVIFRDVTIAFGAWLHRRLYGAFKVTARRASKWNTAIQAGFVVMVLAAAGPLPLLLPLVPAAVVLVALSTLFSGLDYAWAYWGPRRTAPRG